MVKKAKNWNRTRKPGELARSVRLYHRAGRSDPEIADLLNVTTPTVFSCRKRLGLPSNGTVRDGAVQGGVVSGLSRRHKSDIRNAPLGPTSLSERILAVLGESPIPVSTPDLILLCAAGLSLPRSRVWTELYHLEKNGFVKKYPKSRRSRVDTGHGANGLVTTWSLP